MIIAAVSAGDLDRLDQLIASDLVDHNAVAGQPPGLAGFKYWATSARAEWWGTADLLGALVQTGASISPPAERQPE
jgi:hypothetical protein